MYQYSTQAKNCSHFFGLLTHITPEVLLKAAVYHFNLPIGLRMISRASFQLCTLQLKELLLERTYKNGISVTDNSDGKSRKSPRKPQPNPKYLAILGDKNNQSPATVQEELLQKS